MATVAASTALSVIVASRPALTYSERGYRHARTPAYCHFRSGSSQVPCQTPYRRPLGLAALSLRQSSPPPSSHMLLRIPYVSSSSLNIRSRKYSASIIISTLCPPFSEPSSSSSRTSMDALNRLVIAVQHLLDSVQPG